MDFRFSEEQEELREMARAFLAEVSGSEPVRAAMASETGFDPEVWKRIGTELGWTSVLVPEEHGGLGLTDVDLVALLEPMGETLLCAPFLSSVCLGARSVLVAGSEAQKSLWLPPLAVGTLTATLAHAESEGAWDVEAIRATWRRDGEEIVLSGTKRFVVDGHTADRIVVAARETGSTGREGIALFVVEGDAPGLTRRRLPTMDQTRRLAEIGLQDLRVPAQARLERGDADTLDRILQCATISLSAEQIGCAQRALDLSVAYAKERVQYGRPIGSFQAIKHKCADMMVKVESARSVVYYAACVAAEGGEDLPIAASMAKAAASDACSFATGCALQIFGGVGFTWEYDIQLYFKRARSSTSLLGDVEHHRERVARELGL